MIAYPSRPSRLIRSLPASLSLAVVGALAAGIDALADGYVDQAVASLSASVTVAQR